MASLPHQLLPCWLLTGSQALLCSEESIRVLEVFNSTKPRGFSLLSFSPIFFWDLCVFSDTAENKGRNRLLITPEHTGDLETKVADGQCTSDTGDNLIQTQDSDPEGGMDSQDAVRTLPPKPPILSFLLQSPPCQFNPSPSIFCYEEPPSKFPLKIQDDGRLSSFLPRIESFLTREHCSGTVCS